LARSPRQLTGLIGPDRDLSARHRLVLRMVLNHLYSLEHELASLDRYWSPPWSPTRGLGACRRPRGQTSRSAREKGPQRNASFLIPCVRPRSSDAGSATTNIAATVRMGIRVPRNPKMSGTWVASRPVPPVDEGALVRHDHGVPFAGTANSRRGDRRNSKQAFPRRRSRMNGSAAMGRVAQGWALPRVGIWRKPAFFAKILFLQDKIDGRGAFAAP
jgi:hypothetical protein